MLREQGLIKGGNLENAIVIVDGEPSKAELDSITKKFKLEGSIFLGSHGTLDNKPLRYKNEPARHKLLDLLGDLALVGAPLQAQILAARPGHAVNVEFAKKLRESLRKQKMLKKHTTGSPVFDINEIERILPHRYPFLLVDRILELDTTPGEEHIIGLKNVTYNEPFFQGHFPARPIMPGVLIIEAMAQTGGMLMLNTSEGKPKMVFFMAIDKAKFRKPVVPGDQLIFEVKLLRNRGKSFVLAGKAFVDGQVVAEAELMAAIIDREDAN
jgi:UDP-3-O-[3-hydroxymyristoyl] N-acetylglucosamine deacetylase/3-hydroxyacyl-[acyl-carrier-protein] dehydratase